MNPDQLVMEYLAALRVAVTGLPRADDLVADIGARIADVRTGRPDDTPEQVQAFLDSLGNPYEIAANAFRPQPVSPPASLPPARPPAQRARPPILPPPPLPVLPPARATARATEVLAVVALTAGALMLPVIGPVIGLVMASSSSRWHRADKIWAWLLATSPLILLIISLPFMLVAQQDGADAVLALAAIGAVAGPMAAGVLLGRRTGAGTPRQALHDDAYRRAVPCPHSHAHRLYPQRWEAAPYPPRFEPAGFRQPYPPRFGPQYASAPRYGFGPHYGVPYGARPAQRIEPYPVRSSGRSFPKG
jgi:hypothetical protein